ncbi:putative phage integrase [Candidatus Rickettsiella viridis]|uniref:Putative phage integrase n=1 Tax=Candidatus Rickettsiella viridis TaxID=676208 RepID=A0A2Z5UT38_9COXI|nr:site-specific integrase [Candidatus Rickettsiella viridis]BBB14756.1 putative phage integrase [Candidatus Rickettsiella viridis]
MWWIRLSHNGKRIQRSTGTSNKLAAQELHDQLKADLWRQVKLGEKPERTWQEAVVKWLKVSAHKRSLNHDKFNLAWLTPYLRNKKLSEIDNQMIEEIATIRESQGVASATVNRLLALIRSILQKAEREWKWIDKVPVVSMRYEGEERERWLSKTEAMRLIKELPSHLADLVTFSLATGLRQANVLNLRWKDVDLDKRHAVIPASQSKTKISIAVPLNADAISILRKQLFKHSEFVFTYKNVPIKQCNTKAWKKALKRAGIENFRWHDLRHTWASWHVQNGTSLQELQQLGGWTSFKMVLRYAHLNSDQLKRAAERIAGTNLVQVPLQG